VTPARADRQLDLLAAGALPALEEVTHQGWLLRAAAGSFQRSNSALALCEDPGPLPVVERFYAERHLPARVQVTTAGVDARLTGWTRSTDVLIMTAALAQTPPPIGTPTGELLLRDAPWDVWTDCWWSVDGRPGDRAGALAQLALVRQRSAYAAVLVHGQVVGVGRGALHDGWLGVFAMAVLPQHRGRGHGRRVLAALTAWGAGQGGTHAYLQVVAGNDAARGLYEAAGFVTASRYWYRTAASVGPCATTP